MTARSIGIASGLLLMFAPYAVAQDESSLYKEIDPFGGKVKKPAAQQNSNGQASAVRGADGGDGGESKTFRLTGGVTHSERLEPLPPGERTGAVMPEMLEQPVAQSTVKPPAQASAQPAPQAVAHMQSPAQSAARTPVQKLTIPPARTFTTAPVVDKSTVNLAYAQKQAAIKSQAAKLDSAMAIYRRNLQAVVNANIHAGAVNSSRTAVPIPAQVPAQIPVQKPAQATALTPARVPALDASPLTGLTGTASRTVPASARKIKIPHWLSGVWQRKKSNEVSRTELPGGKQLKALGEQTAVVTDVFGTFKDKSGQTWMIAPTSGGGSVDRGSAVDYHKVRQYELIETGPTSCLIKVRATHYVMDKKTRRILAAYQDEELNTYKQVSDGLVKTESSVKVFDELGSPKLMTRAVSMEKRVRLL